jgi:hypothetical protein
MEGVGWQIGIRIADSPSLLIGQRRCAWGWNAAAGANVGGTATGILFRRELVDPLPLLVCRLLMKLAKKRNTPAATCACPAAVGELTGDARFFAANEIQQLPLAYVKAVADLGVEFHNRLRLDSAATIIITDAASERGPQ